MTTAKEFIQSIKAHRGPIYATVNALDDQFAIQIVKSDLIAQISAFDPEYASPFVLVGNHISQPDNSL